MRTYNDQLRKKMDDEKPNQDDGIFGVVVALLAGAAFWFALAVWFTS